jgi:hypothetical protein
MRPGPLFDRESPMTDNTDSIISASIGDAIARLPPSQYDKVIKACKAHADVVLLPADVRIESDDAGRHSQVLRQRSTELASA